MTVVNLGNLPSNEPMPTGQGYGYYCPDGGTEWTYNNTVPSGNLVGGQMGLLMTPSRDCHWRVMANCIWRGPDDVWTGCYWGLHLNRADMDGMQDFVSMNWVHGNTVDWQHGCCEGTYRLQAGIAYSCYLYWFASAVGWNQLVFTADHLSMAGYLLDEGCV